MRFTIFISIWFIFMFSVCAFSILIPRVQKSVEGVANSPHFSVVWKGFAPSYSNQTPDYYVCINNLQASTLQMSIALQINNYENSSFWFSVEPYGTPPTNWTVTNYYCGMLDVDQTGTFVANHVYRAKPLSIPEGRITETISLAVRAYYDNAYTNLYSQDNFTVRFHLIDLTSPAWTTVNYDNFDDGTAQGWSWAASGGVTYYQQYRSWPCALHFQNYAYNNIQYGGVSKTFDTSGPYTEQYFVFSIYPLGGDTLIIYLNGQQYFQNDQAFAANNWYQVTIPLQGISSTNVRILVPGGDPNSPIWVYFDDVYLIGK